MCFAQCPRTLNLDVFVGCKLMGQGAKEIKDGIFPFNKQILVSYSVLGTMIDVMWAEINADLAPEVTDT